MALLYGGVPLLVPTTEIETWIEQNISLKDIPLWTYRAFPGPGLENLSLPIGFYPMKPIRLNRLVWYTGASRWGYIHALVDSTNLALIQEQAYGSDCLEFNKLDLEISSDARTITASLYLANVIPLSGIRGVNGLFLISLVDKRWLWHGIPTPDLAIDSTSTWTGILDDLETALDTTFTVDTIASAYLKPSPDLNVTGQPIPYVLDAIAFSLGMRVLVDFGGKIYLRSFTESKDNLDANLENTANTDLLRSGGSRFPDPI